MKIIIWKNKKKRTSEMNVIFLLYFGGFVLNQLQKVTSSLKDFPRHMI